MRNNEKISINLDIFFYRKLLKSILDCTTEKEGGTDHENYLQFERKPFVQALEEKEILEEAVLESDKQEVLS